MSLPTLTTLLSSDFVRDSRQDLNDNFSKLNVQATQLSCGLVQLASTAESLAGTDTQKAITPSTLQSKIDQSLSGSLTVAGDLIPSLDSTYDVGSNSNFWNKVYTNQIILNTTSDNLSAITGTLYFNGSEVLFEDNQIITDLQTGKATRDIITITQDRTISASESGCCFSISGGDVAFQLPTISESFESYFTFIKPISSTLLINADLATSGEIRNGTSLYNNTSAEDYATVTLLSNLLDPISGLGKWHVIGSDGTWQVSG
jgi:hypothetical protein